MAMEPVTALILLPFVLPIAVWAAWSDLRFMKIPNLAVLSLLAVFVVLGPLVLSLEEYFSRYLHLAVVLAAGFILTLTGVVGAGDAKFLAAMAPFFDRADTLFVSQLFAVVLLASIAIHRGARAVPAVRAAVPHWESWERRADFPMGLALASVIVVYLSTTL